MEKFLIIHKDGGKVKILATVEPTSDWGNSLIIPVADGVEVITVDNFLKLFTK